MTPKFKIGDEVEVTVLGRMVGSGVVFAYWNTESKRCRSTRSIFPFDVSYPYWVRFHTKPEAAFDSEDYFRADELRVEEDLEE